MITRCFKDSSKLLTILKAYKDLLGISPEDYIQKDKNINLVVGESAGLFVYQYPGVYVGHYLFEVRGAEAIALAKQMLYEVFNNHDVKVVMGLTPVENRAALFMTRRLRFTSHGVVGTTTGDCEMFIMTKKDYEVQENG